MTPNPQTTKTTSTPHGFQLVQQLNFANVPISKYTSTQTNLSVSFAQIEGPLVNCYVAVATEANDHDGCPHVLEHMIFLGSEKYPYKGILDQLANRCLAQGTNAWTDVDHTCYTLTTAGSEGFNRLLPVYMDHILYPTVTDTGFHTEVHHVDGEGKDAGVVYCEMQSSENSGSSLVYHTMMETLYEGCGYGYNTGGRVKNLRELTVEKVRNYHRKYYRPDNMRVIVTGKVNEDEVLSALSEIETKIIQKNIEYESERPWASVVPAFTQDQEKRVEFPSDEEDGGAIVSISWRSCAWSDFLQRNALYVLMSYLTDSAVAPLQKEFVESEDAVCGDLSFSTSEGVECCVYLMFKNVETEDMDDIKPQLFELLNEIVKEGIDMKRMKSVIKQKRVKFLSGIEEDPHNSFSMEMISDFIYATNENQLLESLNEIKHLEILETKDSQFWVDMIQTQLIDKPSCTILGQPSVSLGEKIAQEESERLKKQAEELGEEKLAQLEKDLQRAEELNNPPVSEEFLKSFKVPDVSSISFIPITTYRTDEKPTTEESTKLANYLEQENNKPFPFFVQYDHISSEFVSINVSLDTGNLSSDLRKYIELYLEVIFDSPLNKNGVIIPHEEVVYQLDDQSVDHSNGCGQSGGNFTVGSFGQLMWLNLKFERKEFESCVQWMSDVLWRSIFATERLKISAKKLISDVARTKRSPNYISRSGLHFLNFKPERSNHIETNSIKQHKFLTSIVGRLDSDPESVISELNEFRRIVTDPRTMRIHFTGNMYKVSRPKSAFIEDFLPKDLPVALLTSNHVPPAFESSKHLLTERALGMNPEKKGYIFPLASTDSGYLNQSCFGITDFDNKMRAPLLVLIEYFTALEGPFWKQIRGKGLSYNYSIHQNIEEGLLYFILGQSGSVVKAYNEAKSILGKYQDKTEQFEEVIVEAARSAVISLVIGAEETMHMAASNRFTQYLRGCHPEANRALLDRISAVTVEDLELCLNELMIKLFDINYSNVVIVTNPSKIDDIVKSMKEEQGITLEVVDAEEFFSK